MCLLLCMLCEGWRVESRRRIGGEATQITCRGAWDVVFTAEQALLALALARSSALARASPGFTPWFHLITKGS
jgi:hypothetical protein